MVWLESGAGPPEGGEEDKGLAELAEKLPETFRQSIELATCPESVLFFSSSFPEVLLEAAAVHEITPVSPLRFLLTRAVRTKETISTKMDWLTDALCPSYL